LELAPVSLAVLAAATFAGAALQAAVGFGFAIVAAPIYLAVLASPAAVPMLVALHVVQSAHLVPKVWRQVPRQVLGRLVSGAAVGCPLGLMVFRQLDVAALKLTVGIAIVTVVSIMLWRKRRLPPREAIETTDDHPWLARLAGLASGAMTAILVMPGPPLMILLLRSTMPAAVARALSLTFFAICYAAVLILHLATNWLTAGEWTIVALLAPAVWLGTMAGQQLSLRVSAVLFQRILIILLLVSGLGAIISAF
jgi:uncharacterized membrane protein YfcA